MRKILLLSVLMLGGSLSAASAQIRPRLGVPMRQIPMVRPDVPLLLGMNSGHAVAVQDMEGGGSEQLANGFTIGRSTTAPRLGMMGPQRQLVSLVPGNQPMVRVLIPEPGWNPLLGT